MREGVRGVGALAGGRGNGVGVGSTPSPPHLLQIGTMYQTGMGVFVTVGEVTEGVDP